MTLGRDDLPNPIKNKLLASEIIKGFELNSKLTHELIPKLRKIQTQLNKEDAATVDKTVQALYGFIKGANPIIREGIEIASIENRRKDDWDKLHKKLANDPMFKEMWEELLVLMRLEE